jgi:TRAP-type C4-dicarboxylate transport system substrate-binding protein
MTSGSVVIGMNLDTWNKLPKDIQQAIDGMVDWLADLHDTWIVQINEELKASFPKDYGTQFSELTKEEAARWMAADQPVKDAFVKELNDMGLPGTKLMEEYLRLETQYSTP